MDQMKGPFLMGEQITLPDLILTNCAQWAEGARFPSENAKFQTYVAQMRARPAYQKTWALR